MNGCYVVKNAFFGTKEWYFGSVDGVVNGDVHWRLHKIVHWCLFQVNDLTTPSKLVLLWFHSHFTAESVQNALELMFTVFHDKIDIGAQINCDACIEVRHGVAVEEIHKRGMERRKEEEGEGEKKER